MSATEGARSDPEALESAAAASAETGPTRTPRDWPEGSETKLAETAAESAAATSAESKEDGKGGVGVVGGGVKRSRKESEDHSALGAAQYVSRDELAKSEEDAGDLVFKVISNDGVEQHLIWLTGAKNIFSQQLPKMPREYVARLVFDRRHRTLLALKHGRVVGGICFRPFFEQKFAEIAFLAITSSEQVKGYGTRLMNHLKEAVKTAGIDHFLTYADNYAIGYFSKQGFSREITFPHRRWHGYIKDYDGGTLMQCRLSTQMNYLDVPGTLKRQKELLVARVRLLAGDSAAVTVDDSGRIHTTSGATLSGDRPAASFSAAGAAKGGGEGDAAEAAAGGSLQRVLLGLTEALTRHSDAWPFTEPVDTSVVKDYLTVVKTPMDLSLIQRKVRDNAYSSIEQYEADLLLMLNNCRKYNERDTEYYGCADKLEKFIAARLNSIRCMDISTSTTTTTTTTTTTSKPTTPTSSSSSSSSSSTAPTPSSSSSASAAASSAATSSSSSKELE